MVEMAALFGLEICVSVPGAESALNKMQIGWSKHLLGIGDCRQGLHAFLIAECGWSGRLGTTMLLRAIMLKPRIQFLPPQHPAASLLNLAHSALGQMQSIISVAILASLAYHRSA